MSKFASHRYHRNEDDNEFEVKLPPTLVGTEEGDRLREHETHHFYDMLYQEQIKQVQDAPHDPLPGSEHIPGQRVAAVAAHASCSPNREHRESKPQWIAVRDRVRSAEASPPRGGKERALVLGKPGRENADSNGYMAMRAEASLESQVVVAKGVDNPQMRKLSLAQQPAVPSLTQADLKAEATAMIGLLNQFSTNGRPLSQELCNVLKELAAAARDVID